MSLVTAVANQTTRLNLNSERLKAFAKRFEQDQPEAVEHSAVPHSKNFWEALNFEKNLQLDEGRNHTIDVIPDHRYPLKYIIWHVGHTFSSLDKNVCPYLTPYSLVAFHLLQLHIHILALDRFTRSPCSIFASETVEDHQFADFFLDMLRLPLTDYMQDLLVHYASVYDPLKPNLHYVPSYAGFLLHHDFGRFFPVNFFTEMHDIIATTRTNADPAEVYTTYYRKNFMSYAGTEYKNGNLVGTHFRNIVNGVTTVYDYTNYLRTDFETLFNFVTSKSQSNRPMFTPIRLTAPAFTEASGINPYYFGTSFSDENGPRLLKFANSIGNFIRTNHPSKLSIHGLFLGKLQGCNIVNHWIEPFTVPTWTLKDVPTTGTPIHCNPQTFCTLNKLLLPGKPGANDAAHQLAMPTALPAQRNLLLLENAPYTAAGDPLEFQEYAERKYLSPYVHYFQPFEHNPAALQFTPVLGIHIANGDIDAFAIPTADPCEPLHDNNSMYYQGTIRADMLVRPTHTGQHDAVRIQKRSLKDYFSQGIAFFIGSFAKHVLPQFSTSRLPRADFNLRNVTVEPLHGYPSRAFNIVATTVDGYNNVTPNYLYGYSSYRTVKHTARPESSDVWFYLSLRPLYGTNRLHCASRHPNVLIPTA